MKCERSSGANAKIQVEDIRCASVFFLTAIRSKSVPTSSRVSSSRIWIRVASSVSILSWWMCLLMVIRALLDPLEARPTEFDQFLLSRLTMHSIWLVGIWGRNSNTFILWALDMEVVIVLLWAKSMGPFQSTEIFLPLSEMWNSISNRLK